MQFGVDRINRTSQSHDFAIFWGLQALEMVQWIWMVRKFTRGVTYQCKAKDMANVQEYLYGVANVVIYCYNE